MDDPKTNFLRDPASGGRDATIATTASGGTRGGVAGPSISLPVGYRLFEYRIDTVLGQGGFGIAYKATDVNLAAKVVIKEYYPETFARREADHSVVPRDETDRVFYRSGLESFLSEARTLASFRHPHIVRVARFFEANKTAYMVLEYERGESLKSWRRHHAQLVIPEATLASLLAPLLDGLALVHASGYLHRDIKPDNIYVRDDDGSLVLLDFGAARQTSNERSELGQLITPGYAPLEQYASAVPQGPWTDIYALGATLFWLLTGQRPMEAPERMNDPDPLPRAEVLCRGRYSPEFLRAIDWMLKVRPDQRPESVQELRSALFASHAGALGLHEALRRHDERGHVHGVKARVHHVVRALPRPDSWPIAVKMTLAMVATALAPMLLTAYYNLAETQERLAATEVRNLEDLAQSTAGRISQVLAASRSLADYVGTDEGFVDYLARPTPAATEAIVAKLDGLAKANPDIQFAMVMDRAGNAIAASDPEVMGKNFAFRQYFREAIAGRPFMTGIIVGSVAGANGFYFSRPVLGPDGSAVLGAVVLRVKAEPIARILALVKADEDRIPFLVDGDGVIVWHPDPRYMFRSLAPLAPATLEAIVADQRFRRARVETINQPELAHVMIEGHERGHVAYHSSMSHRDEIAGFAPVPGHNWTVGVAESRDFFAAPLERLFEKVVLSVLLAGVVFVALALIFARSIVRPIEELTKAAETLKAGDYEGAHVEARSGDEIGRLARTFNVMIDVLRQRDRERKGTSAPERHE